jgi:hypothetical protein
LLRAYWHKNVSLPKPLDEFLAFLGPAAMPTAWNAEQARADQDRFASPAIIEKTALPLICFTAHATPLPQ